MVTAALIDNQPDRNWIFWEFAVTKLKLYSGVTRKVRPGDALLVEHDLETGEIRKIYDYRQRVLH